MAWDVTILKKKTLTQTFSAAIGERRTAFTKCMSDFM
jgi:hypothetical protein